ncbi:MAG: multiple monosaccharide ABC transporter permease [Paracoccaceae bacterium]
MADTAMAKTPGAASYLKGNMRQYGMLLALVAIVVLFQILVQVREEVNFLSAQNITNLFLQNSYVIIMALGMLLVIVAGHIDLSVGAVAAFVGALAAVMIVNWHWPVALVIPACLLVGGIIGAAQGYWIAYWRIPSFIVTLAGMLVFRGLTLWLLDGRNVGPFPKSFQMLSTGFVPDLFPFMAPMLGMERLNGLAVIAGIAVACAIVWSGLTARRKAAAYGMVEEPYGFFVARNALIVAAILFLSFILATFRGLPNVLISMAVLIVAFIFITNSTTFGRRIYAIGGNEKAAKLSGINTQKLVFTTFVIVGVLAAFAGMIVAARLNSATPKAGVGFELDVIAAVFIGGASMSGGAGTIIGAVIGAFIMGVMNNGMSILGIGIDYQQVIKGLVLLTAVIFDVWNRGKQG